jgi:hypothetical protein
MKLPVDYTKLSSSERRDVRNEYVRLQGGKCAHCKWPLSGLASPIARGRHINKNLFPPGFFAYPVHLHHDHDTGMTIGAVHNICNAVLWQYYGK